VGGSGPFILPCTGCFYAEGSSNAGHELLPPQRWVLGSQQLLLQERQHTHCRRRLHDQGANTAVYSSRVPVAEMPCL